GEQKPELSAPGVAVRSSVPGGDYAEFSGTSMAAPHVTGLIALMVAADWQDGVRDFTVTELERFMTDSAVDLGPPGADDDYGYGRIDAYRAVQRVLAAGDLRGVVRDASTNLPLTGVLVVGEGIGPQANFTTQTGAGGVYSITVPAGNYTIRAAAWGYAGTIFTGQTVFASSLAVADFALQPLPQATVSGFVRSNNVPVADALIFVEAQPTVNARSQADGSYTLALPVGTHDLVVQRAGQRVLHTMITLGADGLTQDFALQAAPSILLVDADAHGGWFSGWSVNPIFRWALDQQQYQYDFWPIQYTNITDTRPLIDGSTAYGIPSIATLDGYDVVIWAHHGCTLFGCYAGGAPGLIGADATLTGYLEHGGRLILSGQDIGLAQDGTPFFDDYLHADHEVDNAATLSDTLTGSGFLQGLNLQITNASLYGYRNGSIDLAPDGVVGRAGDGTAYPVLTYDDSGSGAVLAVDSCSAPYRAVYFAVGYENIGPRAGQRDPAIAEALARSIEWALGTKPAVGIILTATPVTQIAEPGTHVTYQVQMINSGASAIAVQIEGSGNRWPIQVTQADGPVGGPIELAPCQALQLTVRVELPVNAGADDEDSVTVKATPVGNAVPPQSLTLTTVAFPAWQGEPSLPTARYRLSAVAPAGTPYIYTLGGLSAGADASAAPVQVSNERYNACTQTWESRQPMPAARFDAGVGVLNGNIYVVGGADYSDSLFSAPVASDSVYVYNPAQDTWSSAAPLPVAANSVAVAVANNKLYAFVVESNGVRATFAYDPILNGWQTQAPPPADGSQGLAAAELGGKIYVVGAGSRFDRVQVYDPTTNIWGDVASLRKGRLVPGLTVGADGFLYLIGESNDGSPSLAERYDPRLDRWTLISNPSERQRTGIAAVYSTGRIFALGGQAAQMTTESLRISPSFCLSDKVAQQKGVEPGGRVTYTVYLNADPTDLPAASLIDPLPAGTTFAGFGINTIGATYNPAARQIEWRGRLAGNAQPLFFTYGLDVATTGLAAGERLTNTITFADGAGQTFLRTARS
ncbi:MAG: carboxypeptidase regulatory-like domain-containing protein, partial [Chloroflexota bacterium]|nr:carboxypeptidase regulatory-like domain-containing protein [Chloroflexota bacterium]